MVLESAGSCCEAIACFTAIYRTWLYSNLQDIAVKLITQILFEILMVLESAGGRAKTIDCLIEIYMRVRRSNLYEIVVKPFKHFPHGNINGFGICRKLL